LYVGGKVILASENPRKAAPSARTVHNWSWCI